MGPLLGLVLFCAAAASCADNPPTTVAPSTVPAGKSIEQAGSKGCALYCFITPNRTERVDFSLYRDQPCTHYVYGMGTLSSDMQYYGPSGQDEATHSYAGNLHYLRKLKFNRDVYVLLGVELNQRDSLISTQHSRQKLVLSLLQTARDVHVDGLFLSAHRPLVDSPRFVQLLEDLQTARVNSSITVTLGVPMPMISRTQAYLLEAHQHVDALYLMSTPSMNKIAHIDPLLPMLTTPPEQTISYHAQGLAAKGVPKKKIIVGLTAGAVVYTNYLVDSINHEADGRLAPLQEVCGMQGEKAIDLATGSQMQRAPHHAWIAANAVSEQSVGKKVRWITSAGYGGVGLQSMQLDDPKGECSLGAFPLLHMAADNMECREKVERFKGCTRLCYINSDRKDLASKLPPAACSHILVEATLSMIGEVKLTPEAEATAKWLRHWHTEGKPALVISLGARQTSDVWRGALALQYTRKAVIARLQAILTEWRADGVEVSWTLGQLDYPTDSTNLEAFLSELRAEIGKTKTLLLAVSHVSTYSKKYQEMKGLNVTVDHVVLHSHRFHSSRQPFTGHHSPLLIKSELLTDARNTVEGLVAEWATTQNMPRSKIIVGITAEPLSQNLMPAAGDVRAAADKKPFGMLASPSLSSPLFRSADDEKKATSGEKVCDLLKSNSTRSTFLTDLAVPFLVSDRQFLAYENERSVQMKTSWISLHQLGGIALFDVQLDNPDGKCPFNKPFPLLNAIVDTQVCETCVRVDNITPCDAAFTTSCSYRLPTERERGGMDSALIPFDSCNQLVIEEAVLKEDGEIHFRDETAQKAMKKLASMKPQAGMRRFILSLRCDMTEEAFDELLKNGPSTVKKILSFVEKYDLSGIELRCDHLVEKEEKESFGRMLEGLRTALVESTPDMKCPHSLSLRMPIWKRNLSETYEMAMLNAVQHIVLEPFNDPPRENTTHINSPLFPANGHTTDIDTTVRAWAKAGLEKSKIILQIPAYATLQDINSNVTEIGAAASNPRMLRQSEVCSILKRIPEPTMMWDRIAAYAVTDKHEWMSMQNQATIAYKIFYAIREGLGGMGLLALNEDDWEGVCGSGRFPLLTAAKARCLAQL